MGGGGGFGNVRKARSKRESKTRGPLDFNPPLAEKGFFRADKGERESVEDGIKGGRSRVKRVPGVSAGETVGESFHLEEKAWLGRSLLRGPARRKKK